MDSAAWFKNNESKKNIEPQLPLIEKEYQLHLIQQIKYAAIPFITSGEHNDV